MRNLIASTGIAALLASSPGVTQAQGKQGSQTPARLAVSDNVCLDPLDWSWVVKNNRGKNWAASTKDERRESPRFATPCGRMTKPACTENYGYRGRVTGTHYLFKFPC